MMHPLNHHRSGHALDVQNTLHPQQRVRMADPDAPQPGLERPPLQRLHRSQRNRGHIAQMTRLRRIGEQRPPPRRRRPRRIEEMRWEQRRRLHCTHRRHVNWRIRIEPPAGRPQRRHRGLIRQVGLSQHHVIRQRDLLARLRMPRQLRRAELAIDGRHDRLQPKRPRQHRIAQDRLCDRRRIGQSRGLDDQPREIRQRAALPPAEQPHHRQVQIAHQIAAQASVRHHHGPLRTMIDQVAVDRHLAEFIDRDGGVRHAGIAQQGIDQRRLTTAQKAA